MANDVASMKRYALAHGLCGRYADMWDGAESPRAMIDLATDANGMAFLAEGFACGWCPSEDYVLKVFGGYINGAYISGHGGYSGEIWCGERSGGVFDVRATSTFVAECDITLRIPKGRVRRLYVSGDTNLTIGCDGTAYVSVYGDNVRLGVDGCGNVRVSRVTERKFV